jgi:hypothetical protein
MYREIDPVHIRLYLPDDTKLAGRRACVSKLLINNRAKATPSSSMICPGRNGQVKHVGKNAYDQGSQLTSILVLSPSLHLSPHLAKPLGSASNRQKCMSAITKHVATASRLSFYTNSMHPMPIFEHHQLCTPGAAVATATCQLHLP